MKTKNIILTYLFFLVTITGYSQTNISGFINSNTVWDLAGSPYIISGNTLVSQGVKLTIDPGVVVKFDWDKALQIDGEFIAIGTAQNRITFTANQIWVGYWAKVHLSNTCQDAVFDAAGNYMSGSILKYCDFEYGGSLGFGEVHAEGCSPYISHCSFTKSFSTGLYCASPNMTIDSSAFKNNNYCGIIGGGNINNDTITDNLFGGIDASSASIRVYRSYFARNATHAPLKGGSIFVMDCYFGYNSSNEYIIYGSGDTICNSLFEHNQTGFGVLDGPFTRIFDNCFYYNAGYHTSVLGGGGMMNFYNNNVINNSSNKNVTGSKGCCLNLDMCYQTYIHNNNFLNNSGDYVIQLGQSCVSNMLILDYNNFSNPNSSYELYNGVPYGSTDMYVDNNYWGSANTQHVDSVIYDYFDLANQSVVYYSPILTTQIPLIFSCYKFANGVDDFDNAFFNLSIYPNPTNSHFTIMFTDIIHHGTVAIYNLYGQKIYDENILQESKKEIALENISNGIYFVNVSDGNKRYCGKLVVEQK